MATLFISDLHLSPERPQVSALFRQFLQGRARQAEALYILGDLFEVWLGDDAIDPHYLALLDELRALGAGGVPVRIMHGNRDFLLGETFAARAGCTLLSDPHRIDLYGTPTLLMHGDTLCTDDVDYQAFRKQVRDPAWQRQFLAQSPEQRAALARQARAESARQMQGKSLAIMDVNQAAVEQAMRAHGVTQLIHGHTHRPAVHEFSLDGHPARRMVLGDWYEQGSVLICAAGGCRLENLAA